MRKMRKRVVIWMTFQGGLKLFTTAVLVLMLVVVFAYELPSTRTWSYWTLPLSGKTIAIDAGHGGPDGGAVSDEGLIEKDVNLGIALYLRDYLQQSGAIVFLTREVDRDLASEGTRGLSRRKTEDLKRRVEYINQKKADLAVSIHLNSIPSPRWYGAQTFYSENHPENIRLATLIQNEIKRNLENTDRIAKTLEKRVYLLRTLQMPSALVEVGFLSNPEEARRLTQPAYQKMLSASIYQGILKYYSGENIPAPPADSTGEPGVESLGREWP